MMAPRTITARLCMALLVSVLGLGLVRADQPTTPTRNIDLTKTKDALKVNFRFESLFTPKLRKKLKSGLPTRIILQLNLEKKGKRTPVSYFARESTIVYDLWEEEFVVTVVDHRGKRHAKVKTEAQAVDLVTRVANEKISGNKQQPPGRYRIRVLVEINPVSKEMVANIRKWLSRPLAGKGGTPAQTNYFGSFVGIFVDRRIGEADKSMNFVSQWFDLGSQP